MCQCENDITVKYQQDVFVTLSSNHLQLLEQVGYKPSENACSDGTESVNTSKNRYPDILPCKLYVLIKIFTNYSCKKCKLQLQNIQITAASIHIIPI